MLHLPTNRALTSAPPVIATEDTEHATDINQASDRSHANLNPLNVNFFLSYNKLVNLSSALFTWYHNPAIIKAETPITLLMVILALLQSGDVHPNPGPLIDLLQIIAEQNHTPSFNIPLINLFPHQTFDFESFYIDPAATCIVKERCFNIIYSCSAHPNLNDCFAIFMLSYQLP